MTARKWEPASHWDDHPKHCPSDWRLEVENEDTRQSYIDWVNSKLEEDNEDGLNLCRRKWRPETANTLNSTRTECGLVEVYMYGTTYMVVRFFQMGTDWHASVDYDGDDLMSALANQAEAILAVAV